MSKHMSMDIRVPIEESNPSIQRLEELCIKCGACKRICEEYIGVHDTYRLECTNDEAICINCGQCANVCPTGSIIEKYEYNSIKEAIKDQDKIVIFSTSPSVRIALGETFNMDYGTMVQEEMVGLLRKLGASYVLDTNFAADLTINEEASELIERITKGNKPLPQYTSCCPAWVKYAETYYPEILPNISTAKSPVGMQGATIKTYFAKKMNIDPSKIINVAVTPCAAKKYEIRRDEMNDASIYHGIDNMRDMDYVITTRELAKWAKEEGLTLNDVEKSSYDKFMGESSGAAAIFANSGGVMEAAIRTAYELITKKTAPKDLYELTPVRGLDSIKEASVNIDGLIVNVAVIYGTKDAKKVIEAIKNGEKQYHFIEVMTCPGGCVGGGGQPLVDEDHRQESLEKRIASIYNKDKLSSNRTSHTNTEIKELYNDFYGQPLSDVAEQLLHTSYNDKSDILKGECRMEEVKKETPKTGYRCMICGYIYEGEVLPSDYVCPLCGVGPELFEKL